jgi:two-component system KDP operon response regulator KdpE
MDKTHQAGDPETFAAGKSNRSEGKLLIVGDEALSRRALHARLYSIGFDIFETAMRAEAMLLCRNVHYDAVLLDVNVPGRNGIEILVELRHLFPQGAILMLSVDDNLERKLEAFEAGVDDYLTKPFHMSELTARIRVALRWAVPAAVQKSEVIHIGEVSLNPIRHLVTKAGSRIHLTPLEFDLLRCLMTRHGMPLPHGQLLHILWGEENSNRIDCLRTLVRQLRRKIEDDPGMPRYILTESRIGYQFADPQHLAEESGVPR